jgi:hypothetical protein
MSNSLPIRWRSFKLPKRGNSAEEYEDAFAGDPQTGRFAVADGASESSFAGNWARILSDGFVHAAPSAALAAWLKPLRQRWTDEVGTLPLPWYAEEKRDLGAFATFVGLSVEQAADEPGGAWKAQCIGDSCLFHVRDNVLLRAFPMTRFDEFGTSPALLGSRGSGSATALQLADGTWEPGDYIFLMTDALAQWFLGRHERDLRPWQSLGRRIAQPDANDALTEYVQKLRDLNEIRNDDVTLLLIRFKPVKNRSE